MAKKAPKPSGWYKDVKQYKYRDPDTGEMLLGMPMYRLLYDGEVILEASKEATIDYHLQKRLEREGA